MSEHKEWLDKINDLYKQYDAKGAFQILFPEYRPDLSLMLANHLGVKFYDYRASVMLSEGWDAAQISLAAMTHSLFTEAEKSGLVIHNCEALLCTKSEQERQQWLADFFSIDWPNPVILPLTIYQSDTIKAHDRICDIEHIQFPKQTFIMQLAM